MLLAPAQPCGYVKPYANTVNSTIPMTKPICHQPYGMKILWLSYIKHGK